MSATVNGWEVRVINGGLVADRDRPVSGSEGIVAGPQTTYTQTYSTTASTVPNATYAAPSVTSVAAVTTASTQTTPFGYSTQAQADAIVTLANANKTDLAATNTAVAALAVDVIAIKKVVGKLIDDLQALDLAG